MVQSYKAFIFTSTALLSSYSVYAEEFRSQRTPTELASFFPGSVELIPLKNQKYPSLPEDVQEELAFIADQMLSPAHACELYNTLTKTTQIHWCLAADYDSYADRSATRYNLSHHDVKIYNAHDFLELAVSVYDVPSLSTLHVEVQNSLGTIISNAAYSHDAILQDPSYQALLAAFVQPYSNDSTYPELKRTNSVKAEEKRTTASQDYTYTLPFPLPASDFYRVTLRIIPSEKLQEQYPRDSIFQGFVQYLPTDGSYQAPATHAYLTATVIIKPEPRDENSYDTQLWKANPLPSPWDKKETTPVEFNGW